MGSDNITTDEHITHYPKIKLVVGADGTVADFVGLSAGQNIAEGNDPLRSPLDKFGGNLDIDVGTEDIIDVGGTLVETLVGTPATVALYSANANDVLAAATFTMADAGTEDEVIVIASKTYTLRDILTDVDGYVLREAAATDTLDNLIAAINLGAGAGTKYAASTTANAAPTSAVAGGGDTMTLYAETAIVTTSTVNSGWGTGNAVLGTGARTVTVHSLDSTGALLTQVVNMRGITLTDTALSVSFVYRMIVATAGSGATNAGLIKCVDNPETEIYAQMAAGNAQTLMAVYKVPTDHELYMKSYYYTLSPAIPASVVVTCSLRAKPPGGAYNLKHRRAMEDGATTSFNQPLAPPLKFTAGTIIKLEATSDTANAIVYAGWNGYIKDVS